MTIPAFEAKERWDFIPAYLLPPGSLPVQKQTKPNVPYRDFLGNLVPEIPMIEEEDEMKFKQIAAIAALAMGTAACNSATSAGGSVDTNGHSIVQVQPAQAASVHSSDASGATSQLAADVHKPALGPEYKKINSFIDFRKKLLTDGWKPVVNPNCHDAVLGADYDNFCKAYPAKIGCRVCDMVPEIMRHTSDGYNVMHYIKGGTPLSVTAYGDMRSIDKPDDYELVVIGWEYTTSINAILME